MVSPEEAIKILAIAGKIKNSKEENKSAYFSAIYANFKKKISDVV